MLVCNTRNLYSNVTGVQRYTLELMKRFNGRIQAVQPEQPLHGIRGHIWEQFILPAKLGKRLLWSPSNSGPLTVENQVLTVMDVSPMDHPEWMNPRFASWYKFLTPKLVRRVRSVLTISEFTKQRIKEYCPDMISKVHVVHLAADSRFFPVNKIFIRKALERLTIPTPYYLVALGSLEPRKNLQRLLEAWEQIQTIISDDIWLVLAGAKGKKIVFGNVSFEKLPPRVHLTGHVPDEILPALYSGAIASPYISLYEGFGLPPLEAMACGTPVITSNVSSLPEVVGNAAITIDPYDLEAISEALIRLVEDSGLRSKLRLRGLERVKQFNWDKTADKTWQILQQAIRL